MLGTVTKKLCGANRMQDNHEKVKSGNKSCEMIELRYYLQRHYQNKTASMRKSYVQIKFGECQYRVAVNFCLAFSNLRK